MSSAYPFRDMFGKPNEGIHRHRVCGFALVDVALTVILSLTVSFFTRWNPLLVILGAFAIAIAIHRVLGVNTALNVMIFGKV